MIGVCGMQIGKSKGQTAFPFYISSSCSQVMRPSGRGMGLPVVSKDRKKKSGLETIEIQPYSTHGWEIQFGYQLQCSWDFDLEAQNTFFFSFWSGKVTQLSHSHVERGKKDGVYSWQEAMSKSFRVWKHGEIAETFYSLVYDRVKQIH